MARLQLGIAITAALIIFGSLLQHLFRVSIFSVAPFHIGYHDSRPSRGSGHPWETAKEIPIHGVANEELYLLGTGKADITGPVVEINLMGYADPDQQGTGLRQRLFSRAFIIADKNDPDERFVYLVLDTQSGDTAVRYGVLNSLAAMGPEYAVYGHHNIALTGTHSHSGPGAWLNYLLPQITSKGFSRQSYQAIVDGAVLSIKRAHERLTPGRLSLGTTEVSDANINRSPYAYLANPREERSKYHDDVDKKMSLLRFQRASDGRDLGMLTWFAVHGTSMLGNNTLITGDNKGVAAYLFEKSVAGTDKAAEDFVAGFSQSNVGDTSPNVLGAYCEDGSGLTCDFQDSTCNGRNEPCHGRGPFFGQDDAGTKSCFEIGRRQFEGAMRIYDSLGSNATRIRGSEVRAVHTFQDLSNFTFQLPNGTIVSTCPAALGYSFAAGTTDGPGAFDFKQNNSGDPNANPLWAAVSGFLREPTKEQKRCQGSKPILLDVGEMARPYSWAPNIVDIQLLRVGQLVIIVSPGEATTMSGRRWRDAIASKANAQSFTTDDTIVLLGGPANSYSHYIATEEEYAVQRYEGASTLYGPHTLNAFINLTVAQLPYLQAKSSARPPQGTLPPNNVDKSLSFITGVIYDRPPLFKSFGDVLRQEKAPGTLAKVVFAAANPRNNLRLEGTYAAVEKQLPNTTWQQVRDDRDWSLVLSWRQTNKILGSSEVTVTWECEPNSDELKDRYRIVYYGDAKTPVTGKLESFAGASEAFTVPAACC